MSNVKQTAIDAIDKAAADLREISFDIWSHPEENFEEKHAHSVITAFLEKHGFQVERGYKLETAFRSVLGSGEQGPHIAILCEYDALPEIGHACGHNLITEVGLAAGIGVKAAFEAHGKPLGKITVLGTPAEEGGGGKIDLINAGVFKDVDVAMMAHPSPYNKDAHKSLAVVTILGTPAEEGGGGKIDLINAGVFKDVDVAMMAHPFPLNMDAFKSLAIVRVYVLYHGKAAHAAAFPWEGVNALDAAVLCYQNVSCMRQQFKPTWRVHGVIRNGGAKPNIIPELTELEFYARTTSQAELATLKAKLTQCFEAAATSTGCTYKPNSDTEPGMTTVLGLCYVVMQKVEIKWQGKEYFDMRNNSTVSNLYRDNAVKLGVDFDKLGPNRFGSSIPTGSTDMGNVSYEVPSIHPMFYIGTDAVNHTREFTTATGDVKAQSYTLDVGKALAMTTLDILTQKDALLPKIQTEFKTSVKSG